MGGRFPPTPPHPALVPLAAGSPGQRLNAWAAAWGRQHTRCTLPHASLPRLRRTGSGMKAELLALLMLWAAACAHPVSTPLRSPRAPKPCCFCPQTDVRCFLGV